GELAIDFFNENITDLNVVLSNSPCGWTSGRPNRMQLAFTVPQEYWEYLRTHKKFFKHNWKDESEPPQELAFRWTNTQSVVPPSIHPDTKNSYTWINDESHLSEIPESILS